MSVSLREDNRAYRDICLLVLGMAMGSERATVLNSTHVNDYPNELQCLYNAVKSQNAQISSSWLADRGAVVENGKTVRQTLIDKVVSVRNKATVQRMAAELRGLSQTEDPKEFVSLMESCLEKLKGEIL
jgi:hypothetical protein